MKKLILPLFLLLSFSISAQNSDAVTPTTAAKQSDGGSKDMLMPTTEWLSPFSKVVVDGSVSVLFKRVESDEGLKIIYDQRGTASRFRAVVDKNGVLTISAHAEAKQSETKSDITVWYKRLEDISVSHATVIFEDTVSYQLLDLKVKSGAVVTLDIKAMDAAVECTGRSTLKIGGEARYLTLGVSTAKVDALALRSMAVDVDASHEAEVSISVSERLEAATSTSAKVNYKGNPAIVRVKNSLFGGQIKAVE